MLFLLRRVPTVPVQRTVAAIFPARLKTTKTHIYILRLLDHPRVSVLDGGYEGWVQDGHPTTTAHPERKLPTKMGSFNVEGKG